MHIRLKTIDYDMVAIDMMQDELHEQYRKKEESLGVDIC
jgi:homoserine kinase